ncbi:sulfotransferase [Desulfovibrio inopinatus]|uniref:sulfotransferase n=1 Tax=Desulfovibrio inopinatus TaxID=102109 RepID=UPI000426651F|nr:sulfotransferase [Desulfovibrio inopinatus]
MDFFDVVLANIERHDPFSLVKLNHGFWEYRVKVEDQFGITGYDDPEPDIEKLDAFHQEISINFSAQFMAELKVQVRSLPQKTRISFLASVFSWKNCWRIERTPYCGIQRAMKAMRNYVHPETKIGNGLLWKNVTYNNQLHLFIEKIRTRKVFIIGPGYISHFSKFAQLNNAEFIEICSSAAYEKRYDTLKKIQSCYDESVELDKSPVFLFESGDLVSLWFITHLYESCPNATMIDLGQVLNVCNFAYVDGINWFTQHRKEVVTAIQTINANWINDERSYWKPNTEDTNNVIKSSLVAAGIHLLLYPLTKKCLDESSQHKPEQRYGFVENKGIDIVLLQRLLSISRSRNHWANFGPVVELLESTVARILRLPKKRRVVFCKSGTSALYGLVGLEEYKRRRKMKWVVSAFGFLSTKRGPLFDARVVDCDENGFINLAALNELKAEIDGVIVTNTFGLHNMWKPLIQFCEENGLALIYDNATALWGPDRTVSGAPNEIVSFHQTKPWGMGEAGLAVIDAADETTFKAMLNFGVGAAEGIERYSGNEKLSDYDAALVLQRLLTIPRWLHGYRLQRRRIVKIAQECGVKILNDEPNTITNSVAVLMDHPVTYDDLANDFIPLNKYYAPLESGHKNADYLFSRIVNIPCHPEIAKIDEEKIRKVLVVLNVKKDVQAYHKSKEVVQEDTDVQYVFITGCSRSGTSFTADLLRSHPLVAMGRERFATRYFEKRFHRQLFSAERFCTILKEGDSHHTQLETYYPRLISRFHKCRVVGDKIPEISLDSTTLFSTLPDAKVVLLLRNIYDVASSFNARAMQSKERGGAWPTFRDYRSAVTEWNRMLENFIDRASDPNVFIIEFETFFNDTAKLDELYAFVGLDVSPEVEKSYNANKKKYFDIEKERLIYLTSEQKRHIARSARFDLYNSIV